MTNTILDALRNSTAFYNITPVELENTKVTDAAIDAVSKLLNDEFPRSQGPNYYSHLIYMYVGTEKVTGTGRFSKRVSKQVHELLGEKLTPTHLEAIGNLTNIYSPKRFDIHYVDVVDEFNWQDGMFGKEGSCYWGGKSKSRDTLRYYNSLCLRFYSHPGDRKGIGRTWIARVPFMNAVVLFNAYHTDCLGLYDSALIVESLTAASLEAEMCCKTVTLINSRNSHLPWINSDSGMVVWLKSEQEPGENLDLDMHIQEGIYTNVPDPVEDEDDDEDDLGPVWVDEEIDDGGWEVPF